MSVAQTPESKDLVLQEQWPRVRRNANDLPQATFRTALRGFDRDEVRTLLEDVAADYRVLQMKNAALERQLTSLEGVVIAYLRDEGPARGVVLAAQPHGDHTLQRANDDAQAVLARAHAQAEEIVARARARVRTVEQHEQDQERFRKVLGATISDLLTVLTMTRRDHDGDGNGHQNLSLEPLVEPPISRPTVTRELTQSIPNNVKNASAMHKDVEQPHRNETPATDRSQRATPSATVTSSALNARYTNFPAAESRSENIDSLERIRTMLKDIDVALIEVPALPRESRE
jgi:cell division initiation protein